MEEKVHQFRVEVFEDTVMFPLSSFFLFFLFTAVPAACGISQARG